MGQSKTKRQTLTAPLIVVGIGASAGGTEALQTLLGALPSETDVSLVIVQHADPSAGDLLPEPLANHTRLTVQEAREGLPLRSGHLYTVPGRCVASLKNGVFHLSPAEKPEERRHPIDRFFQSLAKDLGERAVGVVLSGKGTDGACGLQAISKAGGMTLAQAPSTAQHDEMPGSALETGIVDHALSPAAIAEEIQAFAMHMRLSGEKKSFDALQKQVSQLLPEICDILLNATGHNFRHYKISTLTRRIQRRIQVLRDPSAQAYLERLKKDEAETRHLFNDLLIGVTAFFRDAEAFEALAAEVLPRLFKERAEGDTIRIWVAGCATGEEAYTLAMLVLEQLEKQEYKPDIQIFATDIDEDALRFARSGVYPLSVADEISPERLKKFFVKKAQHYHVSKELRAMVLFSLHNLINDPPFSKLSLISCRNVLIYLGSHLQKKLIPLFHYALQPGGYLFLGPSENLSSHRELFRPVNVKHRISQRLPTAVRTPILTGRSGPPTLVKPPNVPHASETDTYLLMQRIVLDEFAPKALVVDEEGQIVCASGNLEKYLTVTAGAFHNNAMRLVREGLRIGLRTMLAEAVRTRRKMVHEDLTLRTEDGLERVIMTVQPMPHMGDDGGLFLIVFQSGGRMTKSASGTVLPSEEAASLIEQLERELLNTREDLERTVQDLEAANEEMKSSNEELLSMNEELQSANEELETSKEEVQSANEMLSRVNSDLENLLVSTQIATIFLDEMLHVRRVTPAVSLIYNILPSDTGRPLAHFTHRAKFMPPLPNAATIKNLEKSIEHEVEMTDGGWYIRRILPYRTSDGESQGIVVTFTEVTERKRAEMALRKNEERLRLALSAASLGTWHWDAATDKVVLSPRGAEIFGVPPNHSVTRTEMRDTLLEGEYRELARRKLETALQEHTDYAIEYPVTRPDGERVWIQAVGSGEYDQNGDIIGMIGVLKDISERKFAEEKLRASERLYRAIGESIDYGIWVCDPQGRNIYASDSFLKLVGLTQEECSNFGWGDVLHPDDAAATIAAWKECAAKGTLWDREHRFKGVDGKWHPILARGIPVRDDKGQIVRWVGINLDIRRIKETESRLRESEQRFRNMANNAPVLIWISDTSKRVTWVNQPWLNFTGRALEQEIGLGWTENIHPDDLERCLETYMSSFEARRSFSLEYRLKRHDGVYRWILDYGSPMLDDEGRFIGYIGSCKDITERRMTMEALREADKRKDEFLATLAHELRNPLAPISNGLQVMRMAGAKPEIIAQTRDMMERQVDHMVRLVDDLLDVSRITRGQIELHRQRLEVRAIIDNALELSRPQVEAKGHRLRTTLPASPVYVEGDGTRLSQVVANLINNAAKYTPGGGDIQLSVTKKDGELRILVKDNGIGIPADMLDKIFDVFVQVDTTLERAQGGLGIGLTLVRTLVELHGGAVDVKSDGVGKGSEFLVTLRSVE